MSAMSAQSVAGVTKEVWDGKKKKQTALDLARMIAAALKK